VLTTTHSGWRGGTVAMRSKDLISRDEEKIAFGDETTLGFNRQLTSRIRSEKFTSTNGSRDCVVISDKTKNYRSQTLSAVQLTEVEPKWWTTDTTMPPS
jgi:hypothetical protein